MSSMIVTIELFISESDSFHIFTTGWEFSIRE